MKSLVDALKSQAERVHVRTYESGFFPN